MVKTRMLATGAMLATVAFVAALVASPVNAQTTSSPSGSSSNGEPHSGVSGPHTQAATFTQCPAIGADTGCEFLLTIHPDGTVTLQTDNSQPPYDSSDDVLVGVQNLSSFPVPLLHLTGASGSFPFHFEGDGLCTITTPAGNPQPGCPFGTTGYEGPNTSFSNISMDEVSGDVNFTNGLFPATSDPCAPPTGISTYFSLEGALTASDFNVTPVTPPPCATETAAPAAAPAVVVVQPRFTG
jgi:hypothetical protein